MAVSQCLARRAVGEACSGRTPDNEILALTETVRQPDAREGETAMRSAVLPIAISIVSTAVMTARAATNVTRFSVSVVVLDSCTIAAPVILSRHAAGAGGGRVCLPAASNTTVAAPQPLVTYTHDSGGGPAILTLIF